MTRQTIRNPNFSFWFECCPKYELYIIRPAFDHPNLFSTVSKVEWKMSMLTQCRYHEPGRRCKRRSQVARFGIGSILSRVCLGPVINKKNVEQWMSQGFFCICPPPGLLPVLGPCERYMTPTLDAALLSHRVYQVKVFSKKCWTIY